MLPSALVSVRVPTAASVLLSTRRAVSRAGSSIAVAASGRTASDSGDSALPAPLTARTLKVWSVPAARSATTWRVRSGQVASLAVVQISVQRPYAPSVRKAYCHFVRVEPPSPPDAQLNPTLPVPAVTVGLDGAPGTGAAAGAPVAVPDAAPSPVAL